MKVGDKIKVTKSPSVYYNDGDIGILDQKDINGGWWVNFEGQGNAVVVSDGYWCVNPANFEVIP